MIIDRGAAYANLETIDREITLILGSALFGARSEPSG
jgi:hypothetical protein